MDSSSEYDVVVVGAGIEGSSTAYQLSKRGRRTLLVDMFPLRSSRGSSQGASRIIRRAYSKPYYAHMMDDAYLEWARIEKESREILYVKTGLVVLSRPPYDVLDQYVSTMTEAGHSFETLDHDTLVSRFPSMTYGSDYRGLYDPDAGILKADRCLEAIQKLFIALGGQTKKAEVLDIKPGNPVVVETSEGNLTAASVVICTGPWSPQLLPKIGLNLPLKARKVGVFYWPEKEAGAHSAERFVDIIDLSADLYGMPAFEFPGEMKLCCGYGEDFDPKVDRPFDYEAPLAMLRPYVEEHFPKLDCRPSRQSECYCTDTPNKTFILDRHPTHKNIVIGAGFSGSGFKVAPVVGKILASLVTNEAILYDMTPFSIERFL